MSLPSLTTTQLFTPAPSGVGNAGAIPAQPASGSWLSIEYEIASIVQLPTTSWQSGAPERTILAISAVCLSQDDALISMMAQGAFLSSAATGTVTYQTLQQAQLVTVTQYVTPDPSIPSQNPTGTPGWLDLLGQNVYDVTRLQASYATGPLAIANLSGSTQGPFTTGTYHVAQVNGATYNNAGGTLTIPASTAYTVTALSPGLTTTIFTVSSAAGLAIGSVIYINVPASSGISGLGGVFATVTTLTGNIFSAAIGSSGTYTSGGSAYLCTLVNMTADVIGTGSSAAPGTVGTPITQLSGVFISNVVPWSAANYESNLAYANRCQLSLAAASPNGPSQAYEYFALTAAQILSAATPPYTFTNGPILAANTYSNPQTGIVMTIVASTTPASTSPGAAVTPGFAQNPVTGVTNANPCVVTVANSVSSWSNTAVVVISGVLGTAGVNGTFAATYVSANTFSIPIDTTSAGAYSGGGSVEGGDLGQVDALLQENVVPDGITAVTLSALALPITVVATVTVPQANRAQYIAAAPVSLQTYLSSLPLGGVYSTGLTTPVSYDQIVAALIDAGVTTPGTASYVRGTPTVTVNGGTVDVPFTSNQYQALLASATSITVIGV